MGGILLDDGSFNDDQFQTSQAFSSATFAATWEALAAAFSFSLPFIFVGAGFDAGMAFFLELLCRVVVYAVIARLPGAHLR